MACSRNLASSLLIDSFLNISEQWFSNFLPINEDHTSQQEVYVNCKTYIITTIVCINKNHDWIIHDRAATTLDILYGKKSDSIHMAGLYRFAFPTPIEYKLLI